MNVAAFALLSILALFWLWMLTDCLGKEPPSHDKVCWVLVIILTNIIGALLYLFMRKLPRHSADTSDLFPK